MSAFDELAAIYVETLNRGHGMIERQEQGILAAASILAAGYSKPRVATDVSDFNSLPYESVIRTVQGYAMEKLSEGWYRAGVDYAYTPNSQWLPATVLYEPKSA